ncbi:MAG: carbohydrate ABC transporter permease [Phycisphaerae bacterium]|nr:carbohydrate ABC transporter permease [Phycisphaerae bacterium]
MSRRDTPHWFPRLLVHLVAYALAFTMLVPFGWMVLTSLKTRSGAIAVPLRWFPEGWPWQWQWGNYLEAWKVAELGRFYLNSIIVAVAITVLAGAHNALAGFAFCKLRFAGKRVTFALLMATMMLPYQVYFIFAYVLCTWIGYIDSYQALIVPFLASAFGIFYMRQAVVSVPDSLLDAGRMDGMTDFELFWYIVLPAVRPAVAALAIFTFMFGWNNFFWPLIVIDTSDHVTLPLAVQALATGLYVDSWPVQMAAATIITVPILVVFLIFQRRFVEGITLTGVKG